MLYCLRGGCRQGNAVWWWQWGKGSTEGSVPADDISDEDKPPHTPKKKRISALVNLLGETFKHTRSSLTPLSPNYKAEKEVQQYQDSSPLPMSDEPLGWWKSEASKYPHLIKLAQRYLFVQGTSVPSKRIFPAAGDIISAQRCALTSEHADQLLFLKKNMPWCV